MNSKERILSALNHREPDKMPVDFGSTTVTGMHCKIVEGLREYYGLDRHPVKISDAFQMLGEIEPDLQEVMGVDCVPVFGPRNVFGMDESRMHEQVTPWGQRVMLAADIDLTPDAEGNIYIYPAGDRSCAPSAMMPANGFFIDAIERQQFVDDSSIKPEDNLEEYGDISDADLNYFKNAVE